VLNKLNILEADFITFNMKKLMLDLVFVMPLFLTPNETNPFFSLSSHIKPDI